MPQKIMRTQPGIISQNRPEKGAAQKALHKVLLQAGLLHNNFPEAEIIQAKINEFLTRGSTLHVPFPYESGYPVQTALFLVKTDQLGHGRILGNKMGPCQPIVPLHEFLHGTGIPAHEGPTLQRTILVDPTSLCLGIVQTTLPAAPLAPNLDQFPLKGSHPLTKLIKGEFALAETNQITRLKDPEFNKLFILHMQPRPSLVTARATSDTLLSGYRHPFSP
jgi:hypothetical protein